MNSYCIATYDGEWVGPYEALQKGLGFKLIQLHGKTYGNFPGKKELLRKESENCRNLMKIRKEIRESDSILCSNYCTLFLLVLAKFNLIKCGKIFWFGVYIHDPKMMKIVKIFLKLFNTAKTELKVVVFSKPEKKLYEEGFGLKDRNFVYVPYGEWNKNKKLLESDNQGYFFSGGYANRDFVTLAKLFQNKPWKLTIAASRANTDFVKYTEEVVLSENITVLWDIPTDEFNRLLRYSRAVVMIMKYNTGASGQIVVLTGLEYAKLVIASYTDVIDEYIQDEVTGVILKDKSDAALAEVMTKIMDPANREHYQQVADAGHRHYIDHYSYNAISEYLVRTIGEECGYRNNKHD